MVYLCLLKRPSSHSKPDPSFGTTGTGIVLTSLSNGVANATTVGSGGSEGQAYVISVLANGEILLGGTVYDGDQTFYLALAELHPNGTQDTTFGAGGAMLAELSQRTEPEAMTILPDGEILLAGGTETPLSYGAFLAKYEESGVPGAYETTPRTTSVSDM